MKKAKATLAAHVDTSRVEEAVVRAIPAPEFTKTWRPYSFNDLLDCFYAAAAQLELKVTRTDYSINTRQTRMFGVWEVADKANEDINLAMGIRTSIDKVFANGICAGERVFVCDNLVFDSTFVLFRKHTGRLEKEEITMLAVEAMRGVLVRFDALAAWHASLKGTKLADREAALLTVAALRKRIVPPMQHADFHELYHGTDTKYEHNLWGWHGAVTELYKDLDLHTVAKKNGQLNQFIRYEVPQLIDPKKITVDFVGAEKAADVSAAKARAKEQEEARVSSQTLREETQKKIRAQRRAVAKEAKRIAEPTPKAKKAMKKVGIKPKKKATPKVKAKRKSTLPPPPPPATKPKKKTATKVIKEAAPKGKQKPIVKCPSCQATVIKNKTCAQCGEIL